MSISVERTVGTRIVKLLQDVQRKNGCVTAQDISSIAQLCSQPLHRIQEVVSFFPHFARATPPACQVHICRDMACRLRGSAHIADELHLWESREMNGQVQIHEVSCLGRCDRAPAVTINDDLFLGRSAVELISLATTCVAGQQLKPDSDRETAMAALSRAEIDPYAGRPQYLAIAEYIRRPVPANVLKAIENAGLLGMGGAGGRTYLKWKDVLEAKGEAKYVVCNGDESEPGTFKDRDILLAAPHLVIEGMVLAGLIVGARKGFVYIRHEYHEQIEAMEAAIRQAVEQGACGGRIFGTERSFEIEVFTSPGGYICGEQTALIEAIEGKRAEPRNRPPELQTNGLYDQPTLLNNVETFAWVPAILLREPTPEMLVKEQQELARKAAKDAHAATETASISGRELTPKSASPSPTKPEEPAKHLGVWYKFSGKGTRGKRFFSVSGDVEKPGAYEVPCGISLGELIDDCCGGIKDGAPLKAAALSGPSGGFLPAKLPAGFLKSEGLSRYPELAGASVDLRLLPLDINASRSLGFMLGGGIVIYSQWADMLDQTIACSRFYQRESCGKCVPCRIGSRKIVDLAETLLTFEAAQRDEEIRLAIDALGQTLETTSICGLGQVASNPLRSYLKHFVKPANSDTPVTTNP